MKRLTRYEVVHRPSQEKAFVEAESAQEACEAQGWMVGDCFVRSAKRGRASLSGSGSRHLNEPWLDVERVNYSGFPVQKWILVIPATATLPETRLYLGQDVKVIIRLLGWDPRELSAWLTKRFEGQEHARRKANHAIARMVVDVAGGIRACRMLEPWALAVE